MQESQAITVTISVEEYEGLKRSAYHLKLLKDWSSITCETVPYVIECCHRGCDAVQVTNGRRDNHTLEKNCQKMTMCDFQHDCSSKPDQDTYFCDRHLEVDLFEYTENQKTGEPLYICLLCRNYYLQLFELRKLNGFKEKDIELVIQQAGCSKRVAVEALFRREGDIVYAIMDIKSK